MKFFAPGLKSLLALIFLASFIALGIFAVSTHKAHASIAVSAPKATPVSVATVITREATLWNDFSGRVEAVEQVEVRPQISGKIQAIHFEDGQIVKKGDLLFTIDPRPFAAELARAQSSVAAAQARMTLAQTESDRTGRLLLDHAVSQREMDERADALRVAQANLLSSQADLQIARLNLQYTQITAPVSGRTSRDEITVDSVVAVGANAPVLTTLVSVSPVYVSFDVDEQTYLHLAEHGAQGNQGVHDLPVAIALAGETDYSRRGFVKSIDNRLNPTSGTVRVRAEFANADHILAPGLYARVRVAAGAKEHVLLVSDRAIGTDQDKKFVMVVGPQDKVSYREVVLGPMVDGLRVIRSGLAANERIVVAGLQRVHSGDPVQPEVVAMDPNQSLAATARASTQVHAF